MKIDLNSAAKATRLASTVVTKVSMFTSSDWAIFWALLDQFKKEEELRRKINVPQQAKSTKAKEKPVLPPMERYQREWYESALHDQDALDMLIAAWKNDERWAMNLNGYLHECLQEPTGTYDGDLARVVFHGQRD